MLRLIAHIDGGSRGNPGPAGYGAVMLDEQGGVVERLNGALGCQTNNYAEYQALLAALRYAAGRQAELTVRADSELLVRQMQGRYAVRSPNLQPLHREAQRLARSLPAFHIEHVYREKNREADALANAAMDEAARPPRP